MPKKEGEESVSPKGTGKHHIEEVKRLRRKIADLEKAGARLRKAEHSRKAEVGQLKKTVKEKERSLRSAREKILRQERLSVLGQLAGSVGHELRQPLGVISNAVYYLQTILSSADKKVREYLEIISSEVRHSEKIVSDLMDISRVSPSRIESVRVPDLVRAVLAKRLPPKKIKISVRIPEDLPPLLIDRRQIGQVLDNIILNAFQALPEGGEVTVTARAVRKTIRIAVSDNGRGILQKNLEKIFDPLFTTRPRGIGLGLSVAANLIRAHGGRIAVESRRGKGSTFTLILPAGKEGE